MNSEMVKSNVEPNGTCMGTMCGEESRTRSLEPQTILLVEDEGSVRNVVSEILRSAGYRVLQAKNPEEAVRVLRGWAGTLELLLTDVVTPGNKNGRDLSRELRSACPRMKTIFMSGYSENEALLGIARDPGISFLSKPFSIPTLMNKIRDLLG
jgi:two-component system, cell cycle sensor histidine kinase and response regulator CckA